MKLYIKFFGKEIKHRVWLTVISFLVFVISFHFNKYTVGKMEYYYMLFALAACATILHDDELDFLMLGYIQLPKVFACRYCLGAFRGGAPCRVADAFHKGKKTLKGAFCLCRNGDHHRRHRRVFPCAFEKYAGIARLLPLHLRRFPVFGYA